MRPASLARLSARFAVVFAVVFAMACGDDGDDGASEPAAALALLSRAPLGLHYAERTTLSVRYRRSGQPVPGATLSVHLDRDDSGATLSADRLITNDRGDASVLLTAGASEGAFHVIIDAPLAPSLVVDVAVSRFDFADLDVFVDATAFDATVLVRSGLVLDTGCAQLPATSSPLPAARINQASERRATLPFTVLVVKPYSIYARAEDAQGRLVAYGCVDIPESLLRTGLRPLVPVPVTPVMPNPVGTYGLTLDLLTRSPSPDPYGALACPAGQGQLVLDGLLEALAPVDAALATRIVAARGALDAMGCRAGMGSIDERVHSSLVAASAGLQLQTVANDLVALRSAATVGTQLEITTGSGSQFQARHGLQTIRFALGPSSKQYSLNALPIVAANDLSVMQTANSLTIPPHVLTLQLPSWWGRAMTDLALAPRGIVQAPPQLFAAAVNTASANAMTGCAAIEGVICSVVAAPCAGKLGTACASGRDSAAGRLTQALTSSPPGFDLSWSMILHAEDPSGSLKVQRIASGQVSGIAGGASGATMLSGSASGALQ